MQDLFEFIKTFPLREYSKNQVIITAGAESSSLLIISSGFAKVSSTDTTGNEQVLWIAGRADVVPTEQLFYKSTKLAFTYTALTPVSAYEVKKNEFLKFADSNPVVMKEIARGMSNHYDDLLYRLSSVTQASAREKLAYTLNYIAERFSAGEEVDLIALGLDITHQDLAHLIHASRETASIELKKLKDEGIIDYDRQRFVIYVSKLQQILE